MYQNDEDIRVENAIHFYMLANKLKYIKLNFNKSVADQIYGAMILATAVTSEYKNELNLAKILKIILLGVMAEADYWKLRITLSAMNDGDLYFAESSQYFNIESNESRIAFHCVVTELLMTQFFEEVLPLEQNVNINAIPLEDVLKPEHINKIYTLAKAYGLTEYFGKNNQKNYEIFRFYYLNRVLEKKVRSGWDETHWNVNVERLERISEHIVGTIALSLALASEFHSDIDLDKVIQTLCIHEIGEIIIGDKTPFDGLTPEEKQEIEHQAMIEVIGNLSKKKEMLNLLFEFDAHATKESKFAHYCDKSEADIQAKVYQDMGCQHPLTEQENNIVFKSPKIQEILENGATTAFDVWYEWDKPIYENAPVFSKILKYIKNTNLK